MQSATNGYQKFVHAFEPILLCSKSNSIKSHYFINNDQDSYRLCTTVFLQYTISLYSSNEPIEDFRLPNYFNNLRTHGKAIEHVSLVIVSHLTHTASAYHVELRLSNMPACMEQKSINIILGQIFLLYDPHFFGGSILNIQLEHGSSRH